MCENVWVATNLKLDPALIDEAVSVGGARTKKEAVTAAVREYIARRRRARIARLFGTVDFDPKYDYKKRRRGR
jgi:Arc/MetJ family transcription regulator